MPVAPMTGEIPLRLSRRPRDRRGYVIPFAQFIDRHGQPQFAAMDDALVRRCLDHRLCGLCGEPMGGHIFFIGGPLSTASGYFYDPPMHRDCATFALRTCPHLARAKGRYGPIPDAAELGATITVGEMKGDKVECF